MSRWLPPAGGGYSARSAVSGRQVTKSTAKKSSKAEAPNNGVVRRRVKPLGNGSAGVSRAR